MLAVDTTVLGYAVGADHPLREPCRQVNTAIRGRAIRAVTTAEVIQEFAQVRARRRVRDAASALARSCATLLSPLLRPDEADLRAGFGLFVATRELGAYGARLTDLSRGHRLAKKVDIECPPGETRTVTRSE